MNLGQSVLLQELKNELQEQEQKRHQEYIKRRGPITQDPYQERFDAETARGYELMENSRHKSK